MKKYLIKLIIVMMVVSSFITRVDVYAAASDDYKTFSQGDSRWASHVPKGVSYNLGSAGCFITSIAVLMAYANEDLRDVSKFNPAILSDKMSYSGGGLISTSCSNADKTFTKVKDDDGKFTAKQAQDKILGYLDKGYYVTIMAQSQPITSRTHFSPIVGKKEGKPVVWDVNGGKHSNWDDWAKAGVTEIDVFESSKNPSTSTLQGSTTSTNKADDTNGDSNVDDSTKEPSEEAVQLAAKTQKNEWELVGMPDKSKLLENQKDIELPDRSNLSRNEVNNITEMQNSIKIRNKSWIDYVQIFISFLGLLLCVYSVLLCVALIFDYNNNFIDMSLVSILTLGKCKLVLIDDKEDELHLNQGELTTKMLAIRVSILLIVGMIIVAGGYMNILSWLYNVLKELIQ